MAETPKSVKVEVDWNHPEIVQAIDEAHGVGLKEGIQKGRKEALDYLQRAYIDDEGRPDRDTPQAAAILELARNVARHIRKLEKGGS